VLEWERGGTWDRGLGLRATAFPRRKKLDLVQQQALSVLA
jgi:hypothetical protein